jgi:hypothetical protein
VLYQEGLKVCEFIGATTRLGDCSIVLTKESTSFTLTAAFVDNTESPHSSPFIFNYKDSGFPVVLQVTM